MRWVAPPSVAGRLHDHRVGADAVDARAERHEELREVLDVRLGGGIAQRWSSPAATTAAISAFSVAVTLGSSRKTSAPFRAVACSSRRSVPLTFGAQLLERQDMGVDAPAADHVAAGRRQHHLAAAGEQRPGQQDRGADARAKHGIEVGGPDVLGVDLERIPFAPGRRMRRPTE